MRERETEKRERERIETLTSSRCLSFHPINQFVDRMREVCRRFQKIYFCFGERQKEMNKFNMTSDPAEITVTPPDSLVKYEAPLFVGIEPSAAPLNPKGGLGENNTKLEDMINSILPPR